MMLLLLLLLLLRRRPTLEHPSKRARHSFAKVLRHVKLSTIGWSPVNSSAFISKMTSRVKDIRKIGSVNKGLSLSRPKSSAGVIAPEFLLGTRGPVSVDENGAVSRRMSSSILTASFDGFSLSDLGQRIEEQRRELARERQQTFGGILSDVQGLSNNLLMERNKAEADRQRCMELERRNVELETLLLLLQQQQQQQQQLLTQSQPQSTEQTRHQSRDDERLFRVPVKSSPAAVASVASQCTSDLTSSEAQTDEQETVPACSDNFVWCRTCDESARAVEAAQVLALQCQAELSVTRVAITEHEKVEAEHRESERSLRLQVERLQNALALESDTLAALQRSSQLQLNSVADLASQSQQLQGQLLNAHAHRQQIESQLETETQELQRTRSALEEALRESAAAAAIEQHVKSKLATLQQTVCLQKTQLDEQQNAAERERALLEQRLLQKEELLQQAQAKVAELLQRYIAVCAQSKRSLPRLFTC
jgi:hypothetical protein